MTRSMWRAALVAGVVGLLAVLPSAVRAQGAGGPASDGETGAAYELAGVASVLGTLVYAPFKAVILCPFAAVGAGATWAVTGGETIQAERVLQIGCGGDYLVTRQMVLGRQEIRLPDLPALQAQP